MDNGKTEFTGKIQPEARVTSAPTIDFSTLLDKSAFVYPNGENQVITLPPPVLDRLVYIKWEHGSTTTDYCEINSHDGSAIIWRGGGESPVAQYQIKYRVNMLLHYDGEYWNFLISDAFDLYSPS